MSSGEILVTVRDAVKTYQALRPLRIQALTIARGDVVSLIGLDAAAAEMLIGLVTGAVLPDTGEIRLFGRSTREVSDSDAWLAMLDGVGIMTDRAVLISQFSVEQNIAMPFTLAIDPVGDAVRPQVAALAAEVGLTGDELTQRVADARPEVRARVRLARALALNPSVLLIEHPSATLPCESVKPFALDVARAAKSRTMAVLAVTADDSFAAALGGLTLTLEAATGVVHPHTMWRKLFKRF